MSGRKLILAALISGLLAMLLVACKPPTEVIALAPSPVSAHPASTLSLEARLRAHLEYLTSEACQGRLVGTVGDRTAASYLVDEMKRIGVPPLWKSGYLQEFPVSNLASIDAKLEILRTDGSVSKSFSYFEDFSEILYTQWGMNVAQGQIAAVTPGSLQPMTAGSVVLARLPSAEWRDLIVSAASAQCAAVLLCDPESPADAEPLKYMNRGPAKVPFPVFTVEPGCYGELTALEGSIVRLTVASEGLPEVKGWNVAGVLGNPSKQKTVVVCAHRDHMGTLADGTLFPGAIDNASGVSVVLELARELSASKPAFAVVLLFADSEEAALDGSRFFAANLPFPAKNIVVTLNLDCVGVHSAEPMVLNAGGGSAASALSDLIVAELAKEGVKAALTDEPLASDHQAFEAAGLASVGLLSSVDSFMEYLHNAADTVDAVDMAKLAAITKALAATVSVFTSE